jgi:CHAD domain-containing protein
MISVRLSWITHGRLALAQSLEEAAELYPRPGEDGANRVHESRRALKRAASIARLFAPIVGSPAYAALDAVDTARRQVGRARDLDILPGVLASLECDAATTDVLMRAIAVERGKERGEHAEVDFARAEARLREAAADVGEWDLRAGTIEALLQSLRLSYRAAKRSGRAAWVSGDADDLHELRSRVVDLGHQFELFEIAWPAMFLAFGEELQKLRRALGSHNDLTVLGEFALARRELPAESAETLVALALRRRKPQERRAAAQFERLFAERPGAFARRIAAYLANPQHRARSQAPLENE